MIPHLLLMKMTNIYESSSEDWLDYEITTLPYDMTINHAFEARVAPHPFTNFMNYALLEKVTQMLPVQLCLILLVVSSKS